MATIETRDYLTCIQAAEVLGLSADSVRRYCNNSKIGKTPSLTGFQVVPGTDWLIHKDEIKRYKKERQGKGRPATV